MTSREAARSVLEERLGRRFSDPALLERALTHASVGDGSAPADRRRRRDNERLEFLGDRVLGLLTAELLVASAPGASEGELAVRLNALVNREACARAARRMELGAALRLSPAESRAGGREKDSILADACEAVMAALYLDGGLEAARAAHRRFWAEELDRVDEAAKDPKTLLQERVQGAGRPAPVYEILSREGPDHAPIFTVAVRVEGHEPASARGHSRQAAEKAAAQKMLEGAFPR